MNITEYIILSVIIVSTISFIGSVIILFQKNISEKVLFYFLSISTGVILGNVFIHLFPEVVKQFGNDKKIFSLILFGFIIFFTFEKLITWWHHHLPIEHKHIEPVAYTILLGDGLHNFIDGMIIAGSFLINTQVGISTTVAIILHEIPHEIADFSILIKSGLSTKKALFFNFISGITAFFGAIIVLLIGTRIESLSLIILSFTIGGFIYIAGSDLIPELNKQHLTWKEGFIQLFLLFFGIALMALLL